MSVVICCDVFNRIMFWIKPPSFPVHLFQENADISQLEIFQGIKKKKWANSELQVSHLVLCSWSTNVEWAYGSCKMRNDPQEKKWWNKGEIWVPAWSLTSYLNICPFASKGKEIGFPNNFSHLLLHYIITTMDRENVAFKSQEMKRCFLLSRR